MGTLVIPFISLKTYLKDNFLEAEFVRNVITSYQQLKNCFLKHYPHQQIEETFLAVQSTRHKTFLATSQHYSKDGQSIFVCTLAVWFLILRRIDHTTDNYKVV